MLTKEQKSGKRCQVQREQDGRKWEKRLERGDVTACDGVDGHSWC